MLILKGKLSFKIVFKGVRVSNSFQEIFINVQ
jgi:hypothetical protein